MEGIRRGKFRVQLNNTLIDGKLVNIVRGAQFNVLQIECSQHKKINGKGVNYYDK